MLVHLLAAATYGSSSDEQADHDGIDEDDTQAVNPEASTSASADASKSMLNGSLNGHHGSSEQKMARLPCIYVQCQSPFPQVEEFVDECAQRYSLDLVRINAGMKDALARYKDECEQHGRPVRAVLVGTRIGDPYAGEWSHSLDRGWQDHAR